MAEWICFLHPSRENFAATITEVESEAWGRHFERLKQLTADGVVILAGPTLGPVDTGILVFEAPDLAAAQAIVDGDPTVAEGHVRAELRPFVLSLLRGRD